MDISKTFGFHAGHRLPNHAGKCSRLHGHTYKVDIIVSGNVSTEDGASGEGMVADFSILKEIWAKIEPDFDHCCLLWAEDPLIDALRRAPVEAPTFEDLGIIVWDVLPTAENIAVNIFQRFSMYLELRHLPVLLDGVTVWETPTSWAHYRG